MSENECCMNLNKEQSLIIQDLRTSILKMYYIMILSGDYKVCVDRHSLKNGSLRKN